MYHSIIVLVSIDFEINGYNKKNRKLGSLQFKYSDVKQHNPCKDGIITAAHKFEKEL